jgi:putative peptide zinc metalloprotease protein
MNITEALNVALPEIPARTVARRYPRMDPGCTFKEHLENGKPMIRVYVPSSQVMFKFPPQYWALIQLFDGTRSYSEVAALVSTQSGLRYSEEEVLEFSAMLEEGDFWYKTPQEKNILLMQQKKTSRQKTVKAKSRYADISMIIFPAFNPDKVLTWIYGYTTWIYTLWFTVLTLIAFMFGIGLTVVHWPEIGRDTIQFYTFTQKSWSDIAVLYALGVFVVAAHEFAHAHACKHYGGRVPAMGFALIYLTPAFYTDTTEGMVTGSRYQRLIISLAGIWVELMICAIATPIWWATAPYTVLHESAYFLMLLTGLTSLLINWNPLIKLDGYHMMCEILGIPDLKEDSTAYVSAWVKNHIWGLPVEVPYVPKRRRLGFAVYALLSGVYSYSVLYLVAGFVGNVFRNFDPQWSFIPELGTAALIFRSRIRLLVNFMKFVYLDKRDRVRAWFNPARSAVLTGVVLLFMALPIWHETTTGRFTLEPARRAVVRATVPGTIRDVYIHEGEAVSEGTPLFRVSNLPLNSQLSHSRAEYALATSRVSAAGLNYKNLGLALQERERSLAQTGVLQAEASNLDVASPLSGVVLTPSVEDKLGSYVIGGGELAEIGDLRYMRARLYLSEYEFYKIRVGAPVRVQVDGVWRTWKTSALSIAPISSENDPSLQSGNKYQGLNPPKFYVLDTLLDNSDNDLKPGMTGRAIVYGRRRSLGGLFWEAGANFLGRKMW